MFASRLNHRVLATGAIVALGWAAVPIRAQDEPNLPFWGEGGMTVSLGWNYDDPAAPEYPYTAITPFYFADGLLDVSVTGDMQYVPEEGCFALVGSRSDRKTGTITKKIPNSLVRSNKKYITLQYDVYKSGSGVHGSGVEADPPTAVVSRWKPGKWKNLGGGKTRHWVYFVIDPQPKSETVTIRSSVEAGGEIRIDNVHITTHCSDTPPTDEKGHFHGYSFANDTWPPDAPIESVPVGYAGTLWERSGSYPPEWMPLPSVKPDELGVVGLPGGFPADGVVSIRTDEFEQPEGVQFVACQFDFYMAEGGLVSWEPVTPPGTVIDGYEEAIEDIGNGWLRCRVQYDVEPPPDWEEFRWILFSDPGSGPVAIDNVFLSAGTLLPDRWLESFELSEPESSLHGERGWKGWGDDPAFDAVVTDNPARDSCHAVDVTGDTDLIREFEGFTSGQWAFTAWQYIPADFDSGGTDQFAGSYLVMLNTYADGGPQEESDWSLQMNFDSNDGMLKVYYGNGLNTVNVPYESERWVKIQALIDLDSDWTQVYYDDELVTEYSWTGGVLGGGGGAYDIAVVDLFANGASSIYYDDLTLAPAPRRGDLNGDGAIDFDDIDPFVAALAGPEGYQAKCPDCDWITADCNEDGAVNFDDIDPFVALLGSGL